MNTFGPGGCGNGPRGQRLSAASTGGAATNPVPAAASAPNTNERFIVGIYEPFGTFSTFVTLSIDRRMAVAYGEGQLMSVTEFPAGGYRYVDGAFQYSCGVAALPGHRITRVRFQTPLPIAAGFARIEAIITAAGRPLTAFCACELRSPEPFTETGFSAFNRTYVEPLKAWGLLDGERNPVARSNVCPAIDPPPVPSFYAFSFTEVEPDAPPSFVIAGCAEAAEGGATYEIVRAGDTSTDGMREKARFVLGVTESRMHELGFAWPDTTGTHMYTVQDVHPIFADELVRRGVARAGVSWHFNRPPVSGLEYEMDTRGVMHERVVA